ncbi:hypothetical protein QYE76_054790 [Lolium multiflorum]|uniref:Uncharacterized protein n=1 Tax=Lolium multiflorum TaxID=4521 RepID=A0AAD8SYE5_LOLMU|nr:hypothetical protein QYE76_054790 [Lolium multiflorum]
MRRRNINEDLMTTAESSPSGQDDDANVTVWPPPAVKNSTGLFADEDDLDLPDDDDEVPLAKRAKLFSERSESARQSNPSAAKLTPPRRTVVAKVPVSTINPSSNAFTPSTARDHPIFATADVVADFADQFTRLESENAQLRKAIKVSADQVLEANKLTAGFQNENILLKDERKKLKKKMKDEQEARREAAIAADEKEGALRESISSLLSQVARPSNRQDVAKICGTTRGARDPLSGLGASRLFVAQPLPIGGFWRVTHSGTPVGQPSATSTSTSASEMAEEQIAYEDLPPDHKKKYDELKAIVEAELIGSFEKTRSHGIGSKDSRHKASSKG